MNRMQGNSRKAIATNYFISALAIAAVSALLFHLGSCQDECSRVVISRDVLQKASPYSHKNGTGLSFKDIDEIRNAVDALDKCKSRNNFAKKENTQAARQLADSLEIMKNDLDSFSADGRNFDQVLGHPAHKRKAIGEIREALARFLGNAGEK